MKELLLGLCRALGTEEQMNTPALITLTVIGASASRKFLAHVVAGAAAVSVSGGAGACLCLQLVSHCSWLLGIIHSIILCCCTL